MTGCYLVNWCVLHPDIVDRKHGDVTLQQSKSENNLSEQEELCSLRRSLSDAELDSILSPGSQIVEKGNHTPALACGEVHWHTVTSRCWYTINVVVKHPLIQLKWMFQGVEIVLIPHVLICVCTLSTVNKNFWDSLLSPALLKWLLWLNINCVQMGNYKILMNIYINDWVAGCNTN